MRRNLSRRLEILFPVLSPRLGRRLIDTLKTYFADNVKAHQLQPDGTYQRVSRRGPRIRAQETFHKEAIDAVRSAEEVAPQFQPLTRKEM